MKKIVWVTALLILLSVLPAFGQGKSGDVNLKDILAGKIYPQTLQLKDLDSDWICMNITGNSDMFSMYVAAISKSNAVDMFFTKGDTVQLAGQTYMVAYQLKMGAFEWMLMMDEGEQDKPEKLTRDSELILALINLQTTGNFTNIHSFSFIEFAAEHLSSLEAMKENQKDELSKSNIRLLGIAFLMLLAETDDYIPKIENSDELKKYISCYIKDDAIWVNPHTGREYVYNYSLSEKTLGDITDYENTVVFYEDAPKADGTRGVCIIDGTAKRVTPQEWEKLKKISNIK